MDTTGRKLENANIFFHDISNLAFCFILQTRSAGEINMRQLKGKVKEPRKEKRERKQENLKNKGNLFRIVIPTLIVLCAVVIGLVYMGTRQKQILEP